MIRVRGEEAFPLNGMSISLSCVLVGAGRAATWPLRGCSRAPRLSVCLSSCLSRLVWWGGGERISGQGPDQTIQESEIYIFVH